MIKGHFHSKHERNEYYLGIRGYVYLLYMDENPESLELMSPGSLHYIGAKLAHRVINTGNKPFTFLLSWPDYITIQENGFSMRVIEKNCNPIFLSE